LKESWKKKNGETVSPIIPEERDPGMVDMSRVGFVEIIVAGPDGDKCVWVNVDGICRFRAYRVTTVFTMPYPSSPQREEAINASL
jgi:hypothetical protein